MINSAVTVALAALMTFGLFFPAPCFGKAILIDPDRQFSFAEACFKESDYPLAIDEYKRFIHFFPDDERIKEAKRGIAMSWFFEDRMDKAIHMFDEIIDDNDIDDFTIQSYFGKSRCHERLKQYGDATAALLSISEMVDSVETKDEAYYRMGWIWLQSPGWENSGKYFDKISAGNREKYKIPFLTQRLDEGPGRGKSPLAAGLLAAVPGLGHMYCGRYHDAAVSFFLNVALALSAWELFKNDNNALGSLVTLLEIGFYSGNISSAVRSAHKYNRRQKRDFIDHLKKNLKLKLSAEKDMGKAALSIKYRF